MVFLKQWIEVCKGSSYWVEREGYRGFQGERPLSTSSQSCHHQRGKLEEKRTEIRMFNVSISVGFSILVDFILNMNYEYSCLSFSDLMFLKVFNREAKANNIND